MQYIWIFRILTTFVIVITLLQAIGRNACDQIIDISNQGQANWILLDQMTGVDWKRRDEPDTRFPPPRQYRLAK